MKIKKKSKKIWIALLIILLTIITVFGVFVGLIMKKFGKVTFFDLDKTKLDINENLYNDISDKVSKNEYDSIINILLIGTDSENGYDKEQHSDVIMILSVNQSKKTIKLISIPRDTAVDIPDYKRFKLNKSYSFGQEQLLIQLINSNFDLNLEEYVTIDFSGMIDVINRLGGIEMDITYEEMNYINKGLVKMYNLSGNDYEKLKTHGKVTLNGEQAMVHARNRTVGNDFTRAERHRDVISAVINKIASMSAEEIWNISDYILDDVKTNVNIVNYLNKVPSFLIHKNEYLFNITSVMIPSLEYSKGLMEDRSIFSRNRCRKS
ncbi:MAG: LCP family protein [Clostridia bacterium]|nr:LCP family protein [Clostridia bacterium]